MQNRKRSDTFPIKQQHCIGIISLNASSLTLHIALAVFLFEGGGYEVSILNSACRGSLQPKFIPSITKCDKLSKSPLLLALTFYHTGARVYQTSFQCEKYIEEGESKWHFLFRCDSPEFSTLHSLFFVLYFTSSFCFTVRLSDPKLSAWPCSSYSSSVFSPFCFLPLSLSCPRLLWVPSVLFSFSLCLIFPL